MQTITSHSLIQWNTKEPMTICFDIIHAEFKVIFKLLPKDDRLHQNQKQITIKRNKTNHTTYRNRSNNAHLFSTTTFTMKFRHLKELASLRVILMTIGLTPPCELIGGIRSTTRRFHEPTDNSKKLQIFTQVLHLSIFDLFQSVETEEPFCAENVHAFLYTGN